MRPVICIFAKPPVAGQVKTRVGEFLGHDVAEELARALLQDAWEAVAACAWARPVLATTDPSADHGIGEVEAWDQGGGDLGDRVERILRRGVAEEGAAFAVGADTAALTPERLHTAWTALEHTDAVMGPSDDGGFWLLGVKRCPDGLLADLPWSQRTTAVQVMRRVRSTLGTLRMVDQGFDVDTWRDLSLVMEASPDSRAGRLARRVLTRQR